MDGTIFNIKTFAVHDGPGIRTTIFLKGCPLKCAWCHNPEGVGGDPRLSWVEHKCAHCGACVKVCPEGAHAMEGCRHILRRERCLSCGKCVSACFPEALRLYGETISPVAAARIVVRDKPFYDNSGGGLTVSGGEPLLQPGFVRELFEIVKEQNIHTAVDTSGAVPVKNLDSVMDLTDLFLFDLKHPEPDRHREGTGMDNRGILENLRRLSERGKAVEVRIPLIPGYNDGEETIGLTGAILGKIKTLTRVVILPYHDYARSKYTAMGMEDTMPHVSSPSDRDLLRAAGLLQAVGVNAVSGRE
jgi:pyruvate formate lyase activating enzyme